MSEKVAWFAEPPNAMLKWGNHIGEDLGYLHFVDPNGERAVIWVTKNPAREQVGGQNVWQIAVDEDSHVATVSPSIHFIGHWHSPNPVQFNLVEEI